MNDEPFLVGTSWQYFLKAYVCWNLFCCVSSSFHLSVAWARKYGLRIYLDLHALPGSQNGWVCVLFGSIICITDIILLVRITRGEVSRLLLDHVPFLLMEPLPRRICQPVGKFYAYIAVQRPDGSMSSQHARSHGHSQCTAHDQLSPYSGPVC